MEKFINLFKKTNKGEFKLTHGEHELFVKTKKEPKSVHISFNKECIPTCAPHEKDMANVTITRDGFILFACIKSNSRIITWEEI